MVRRTLAPLAIAAAVVACLTIAGPAAAQAPPPEADSLERVLVFSKTAAFRHGSIPFGITAIQQLGAANGFAVDATEDSAAFNDDNLARYDAVVWLSTTGDVLNAAQEAAFERYVQGGGGYVGIHAASDTEYSWKWYGNLVGAYFRNHPPGTPTATADVEDLTDHSTLHLPARWTRVDEWYNFKAVNFESTANLDYSPRGTVHVLVSMDESTYNAQDGNTVVDDHPMSWCKRYDGGRSWYTGMGHTEASFLTDAQFLTHVLGGIEVAAAAVTSDTCGNRAPAAAPAAAWSPTAHPLAVTLSPGATDADGDELTYEWDFGDGSTSTEESPYHRYAEAGVYTVVLTVTDRYGASTSEELSVAVPRALASRPPRG